MFVARTAAPPAVRARHRLPAITWDTSSARPKERHGWDAVGSLAGKLERPAAPRRLVSDPASRPSASGARSTRTAAPGALGIPADRRDAATPLDRRATSRRCCAGPPELGRSLRGVPQLPRTPAARRTSCGDALQPLPRQLRHRLARVLWCRALAEWKMQTAAGQITRWPFSFAALRAVLNLVIGHTCSGCVIAA